MKLLDLTYDDSLEVSAMATPVRPSNVPTIQCDVCMKEIPASESKSAEARDYVMNFCGLECYDQWRKNAAGQSEQDKTKS